MSDLSGSLSRAIKGLCLTLAIFFSHSQIGCTRSSESTDIKSSGGRVGQFKGHIAIHKILVARWNSPGLVESVIK